MARYDIMPYNGGPGGQPRIQYFPLDASETFEQGEVVQVDAGGDLREPADDPDADNCIGIAAGSGNATVVAGTNVGSYPTARSLGQFAVGSPQAAATNDLVPVYMPDPTTYFITANFSNAGTAFGDAAPAATDIGDEVGLALISGVWGVDQGATNNLCRIVDVLDAQGMSIDFSGGTGVSVVFAIVAHQMMPTTGVAAAPAA